MENVTDPLARFAWMFTALGAKTARQTHLDLNKQHLAQLVDLGLVEMRTMPRSSPLLGECGLDGRNRLGSDGALSPGAVRPAISHLAEFKIRPRIYFLAPRDEDQKPVLIVDDDPDQRLSS